MLLCVCVLLCSLIIRTVMDSEEERDPSNEFFTHIDFLTQSSSSTSSTFEQLASEVKYSIMSRQVDVPNEKGADEEAIVGGARRVVFNPYANGYQSFPSSSTPITPSAAKKRRVEKAPSVQTSEREDVEEGDVWNLSGRDSHALVDTLNAQMEDRRRVKEDEEMDVVVVGTDVREGEVSVAGAQQSVNDVFVTVNENVVVEEEAGGGAMQDTFLNDMINWDTPDEVVANEPVIIEKDTNVDIDLLAKCIVQGKDGAKFEAGEREEICDLTSNSKGYCDRQSAVSKRFLGTAADRCGEEISHLATALHEYRNGTKVPLLYHVLSGVKDPSKKIIINAIMVQCALSWRLVRGHRDKKRGDFPESSTWDQWLKLLQGVFARNHIQYQLKTEFFGRGEFHAVLERYFREEKKKNPKYGTGQYASFIPEDLEDMLLQAIEDKKLDLSIRWHLQLVCHYLLGARLCIRGGTECMDRCWSEFEFVTEMEYEGGQARPVNYIKLVISETIAKNMQITVRGKCCCNWFIF